jgi:eukaryotic-like serine/threonine-protein kinase
MKSDPDRELTIFTEALKLLPEEREAFLKQKCLCDNELRQRLEALLRAHERLGNFLEEPPTDDPSIERN